MDDGHIDPLAWAASVGLKDLVTRFPDDVLAAWRDARRDLDDLPDEASPLTPVGSGDEARS